MFIGRTSSDAAHEVLQKKDSEEHRMAKPVRKYGTGAITVAVFEKTHEDGVDFQALVSGTIGCVPFPVAVPNSVAEAKGASALA